MKTARLLTKENFSRAAEFLRHGRPLEGALFAYFFESGSRERVRQELRTFQNPDGGFHELEPDTAFSHSTALSTAHALHTLREIGAPVGDPLVQGSLDYLITRYDPALTGWCIIPPHDNSQPHAPWWHFSEEAAKNPERFDDNPRPDLLAGLFAFPSAKTAALRLKVAGAVIARLHALTNVEMHGLLCYLRLHAAPGIPVELKQALDRRLPAWIAQGVERDPAKWSGYGLRPLDVAPRADSPWRSLLEPDIAENLDYLVDNQARDGSWHPHWNWGDAFPDAWPAAKNAWQSQLTLRALESLRSYGRIAQ